MICNFDGMVLAHGTTGRVDEIITAEVRPDLVREAAGTGASRTTSTSSATGATRGEGRGAGLPLHLHDRPRRRRYRLPWEDQVVVTDGTSCGFPAPTRPYGTPGRREAAE